MYNSIQLGQWKRLWRKEIGSRQESENNGKHLKTTLQNDTSKQDTNKALSFTFVYSCWTEQTSCYGKNSTSTQSQAKPSLRPTMTFHFHWPRDKNPRWNGKNIYIYIYIYAVCIHKYVYIYIYVHIFVHIHTYIYIYVYIASSRLLELPKPELGW